MIVTIKLASGLKMGRYLRSVIAKVLERLHGQEVTRDATGVLHHSLPLDVRVPRLVDPAASYKYLSLSLHNLIAE